MTEPTRRRPQVFDPADPRLVAPDPADATPTPDAGASDLRPGVPASSVSAPPPGLRWSALFVSAVASLAVLALGVSFARFISEAVARDDIVGWIGKGLLAIALFSGAVLALRELVGLARLARLGHLRREAEALVRKPDARAERALAGRLVGLLKDRPDSAWAVARFRDHRADVLDAGALLRLADRELFAPLDREARRMVLVSAKRVATVTALSPIAIVSVGFVLVENLGLLRRLAALYGGRPGLLGSLRLARLVIGHIIATGGIAMTDDLLGQFLGQDLLRRLSRRLGEGVFNGALTARLGVAAIEVCRPLPYLEAAPVRARDIVGELFRAKPGAGGEKA
ncbi:MAG: YcjF family protein [Hyphomicrobiaceae bacterium]